MEGGNVLFPYLFSQDFGERSRGTCTCREACPGDMRGSTFGLPKAFSGLSERPLDRIGTVPELGIHPVDACVTGACKAPTCTTLELSRGGGVITRVPVEARVLTTSCLADELLTGAVAIIRPLATAGLAPCTTEQRVAGDTSATLLAPPPDRRGAVSTARVPPPPDKLTWQEGLGDVSFRIGRAVVKWG